MLSGVARSATRASRAAWIRVVRLASTCTVAGASRTVPSPDRAQGRRREASRSFQMGADLIRHSPRDLQPAEAANRCLDPGEPAGEAAEQGHVAGQGELGV